MISEEVGYPQSSDDQTSRKVGMESLITGLQDKAVGGDKWGSGKGHLLNKPIIKGGVSSVTERVRAPLEVFSSHGSRTSESEVNRNT